MKKTFLLFVATCLSIVALSQEITKEIKHFTRIVASPRVNLILMKGDKESVRVEYHGVSEEKINIDLRGKTLRLYLDDARKFERRRKEKRAVDVKHMMYEDASVTAYVTFKELDMLEIRGDQELSCLDPIEGDAFTLRAYGENQITLSAVKTGFFKAKLYGQNDLRIRKGRTLEQKYMLYGENTIDTKGVRSDYIVTRIFGEGSLRVNSAEEVRIDAFGEPDIHIAGGAQINKRLVIGKPNIQSIGKN